MQTLTISAILGLAAAWLFDIAVMHRRNRRQAKEIAGLIAANKEWKDVYRERADETERAAIRGDKFEDAIRIAVQNLNKALGK